MELTFLQKTVYKMILSIQMFLESKGLFWKLLDDKEEEFQKLRYTCDNIIKERASGGLGSVVHQAEVLSYDDKNFLWNNGFLRCESPEQLVRTALFQVGLNCALRAGSEHRNLRAIGFNSQFSYVFKGRIGHIIYREDLGTKTNKGGLKHKKVHGKEVMIYPNTADRMRCPITMFYKYHFHMPVNRKSSAFYLRLCPVFTEEAWFMDAPMGINKLRNMVKDMTQKAGLTGHFTNH